MSVLKILGLIVSAALFGLAAFLAQTPWRAHGGRFITEYLVLSGVVALVALVALAAVLRWA
jgi:hypothetical protein